MNLKFLRGEINSQQANYEKMLAQIFCSPDLGGPVLEIFFKKLNGYIF